MDMGLSKDTHFVAVDVKLDNTQPTNDKHLHRFNMLNEMVILFLQASLLSSPHSMVNNNPQFSVYLNYPAKCSWLLYALVKKYNGKKPLSMEWFKQ